MAIRTVVTRGYGNGTFNGTISLVVIRGYTIGAVVIPPFNIKLPRRPDRKKAARRIYDILVLPAHFSQDAQAPFTFVDTEDGIIITSAEDDIVTFDTQDSIVIQDIIP